MEQGHCVLRLLPSSISLDSKLACGRTANLPNQQPPDSQTQMSGTFRRNSSIGRSYYSRSELFCTHGVLSGNFPTRCYLPFLDHVLSFHHKDAVMQVNASACVIRNDPEPVANVNLGATWNG